MSIEPITKKPTRKDLLKAISDLQNLVGRAKGAYMDDRNPNRWTDVCNPLDEAFNICVNIQSFDKAE